MTTYIESKLNPDGLTYDHSEVIEAHKKGAKVDLLCGITWVRLIHEKILFDDPGKYRAVIEDKPEHRYSFDWRHGPAEMCRLIGRVRKIEKYIQDKFKAPTEAITLTRAEVNEVFPGLLK